MTGTPRPVIHGRWRRERPAGASLSSPGQRQWAAGFDVRLALEFRGSDAFCTSLDTALGLVAQCGEPNVGVCLDLCHAAVEFEDLAAVLREVVGIARNTMDRRIEIQVQIAPDGRRVIWLAHESAPKNFTAVDVSDPRKPKVICQTDLPQSHMRSNSLETSGQYSDVGVGTITSTDTDEGKRFATPLTMSYSYR